MKIYSTLLIPFIAAVLHSCSGGIKVDLIIHNANVHTMVDGGKVLDAIAIKDGKIVEVGAERQILNKYDATEHIDAKKKDVYPGWVDAHGHIFNYARLKLSVDLVGCTSYDEMLVRIEKYHSKHQRPVIIGRGWDQSLWGEDELPNNRKLSELFPDIPVCLYRIDGHALLANDFLIQQADVYTKFEQDPELKGGGYYLRDKTGAPTGVFVDNAMEPIMRILPDFPKNELTKALMEVQQELLSFGITGVHEAGVTHKEVALLEEMIANDALKINLYAMLLPSEENIAFARREGIYQNENLLIRSFKVYGDGALGSRGACLKDPYHDHAGHLGYLTTSLSRMQKIADLSLDLGYQMNTHAIGDSANYAVLSMYKKAFSTLPDHRWRIEHAQVIDPADFELFARYGVFPSVQPTHATSDQRWAESRLGKERMAGAYAYRSLLEQFGMLAIGTDFPVEYIDPFLTIHSAVNRKNSVNFPEGGFLADQRISLEDCIKGMTIWAAYASFTEAELGTLEKGKRATITMFDKPVVARAQYEPNFAHTVWINGKKVYSVE